MKQASKLVDKALSQPSMPSSKPSQPEKRPKLPQPLLDNLWLKMAEIYGRRWTGSFGVSVDQSHAWAATLGGLTGEQIAVGLNALASTEDKQLQDWPPAAPKFRALCLVRDPEAFGLPSEEKAYREACSRAYRNGPSLHRPWSHPAVCHAALETGFHTLNTLKEDASRKLFARNYGIACRMVMDGEPLRTIPLGLPDPESVGSVRTEEGGRRGLASLHAALRGEVE